MADDKNTKAWVEALRQTRDELRVRLHLGSMEAQDEWKDLEEKWQHFEAKAAPKGKAAVEVLDETAHALGKDLKKGYETLRERLKG